MAETYRPPKAARAELDLPASLTADEVADLRTAGGEAGRWANAIVDGLRSRTTIKELYMHQRAEGLDTPLPDALAALMGEEFELAESYRVAFDIATSAGQQGIANFLAERQDAHALWAWHLRASLGVAEVGQSPALDAIVVDDTAEEDTEMHDDMEQNSASADDIEARKSALESCEKRSFLTEVRADRKEDGNVTMRGYAAVFDQEATGLPFREVIRRGAFAESLSRGDEVYLLVNHNIDELPLARRSSGTLTVSEDDHGLLVEADLDPTNPRAAELISALSRNDVSEMSFAFRIPKGGEVRNEDGLRELRQLDLFEASVTTWGAYNQTDVGLRSAEINDDTLVLAWKRAALRLRQQSL